MLPLIMAGIEPQQSPHQEGDEKKARDYPFCHPSFFLGVLHRPAIQLLRSLLYDTLPYPLDDTLILD